MSLIIITLSSSWEANFLLLCEMGCPRAPPCFHVFTKFFRPVIYTRHIVTIATDNNFLFLFLHNYVSVQIRAMLCGILQTIRMGIFISRYHTNVRNASRLCIIHRFNRIFRAQSYFPFLSTLNAIPSHINILNFNLIFCICIIW